MGHGQAAHRKLMNPFGKKFDNYLPLCSDLDVNLKDLYVLTSYLALNYCKEVRARPFE